MISEALLRHRLSFLLAILTLLTHAKVEAQSLERSQLEQLKFRHIGPVGNRIISVSGISGDPLTYYVGAATGGIWKTGDGGLNWKPVFDKYPVHSIGAIAVAPSDPQVIYAGTGESFIRSNVSIGNGVWKSTDGGETWSHLGLDSTGRISRIVVHPTDADILYVASVGHGYSPQKQRGVFKSNDGGMSWKLVLFVDENTGASDIVMDPNNPRILFAGMWQLELKTWIRISGGPGSGLYMSKDAGETWSRLEGSELPKKPVGKIALAMTPAAPDRVYALIETGDGVPWDGEETESGELWRSDDKGKTWKLINSNRDLGGRQAYYTRCAASPDNPNEIYFLAANYSTSIDGGKTVTSAPFLQQPNWDHHEMWIDPTDGDRMIVVGDGGLSISMNRGASWHRVHLPVAQLYHVTTDTKVPYNVLTNRQDGPSMKGPSRSGVSGLFGGGVIHTGVWYDIGGGESGFATADPTDPDIIWSSASGYGPLGGIVTRYDEKTRQYRQVEVWPELLAGHAAKDVKYRFQWTFPLLISPHDNNTVYVASQHVHRTTDQGQSWQLVSPDLTLDDSTKQTVSGGLTPDNIAVEYANVIYAFDESPLREGLFWAGTNDGLVHISRDGGETWQNVTANIPGLPPLGTVRNIDASKWNEGAAYLTVDFHQVGDFAPYVYKTKNYGQSWTKIVNGIADSTMLNYARCVREDPVREGLLYVGTENALYFSLDDGENWQSLMTNLPASPMYWIDIPEHFNDMVVGTYGRGIWILDDISPLQQMSQQIVESDAYLFDPKPIYRLQPVSMNMQFFPEASSGKDPPYGGSLHYWLAEDQDTVLIQIVNTENDTLRTIEHKGKAGLNRVWWNLRTDSTDQIVFRTKPRYAEWVPLGEERKRKSPVGRFTMLVPPGDYEVRTTLDSSDFSTSIRVMKDPNSEGDMTDITAQTELMQKLYEDMNEAVGLINQIESLRRQISDLAITLKEQKGYPEILESISSLDSNLIELEGELTQLKITGTGQDQIRYPAMLVEKISYLASTVPTSDFPPANSHLEVYDLLRERLNNHQEAFEVIRSGSLQNLMELFDEHGVKPVMISGDN